MNENPASQSATKIYCVVCHAAMSATDNLDRSAVSGEPEAVFEMSLLCHACGDRVHIYFSNPALELMRSHYVSRVKIYNEAKTEANLAKVANAQKKLKRAHETYNLNMRRKHGRVSPRERATAYVAKTMKQFEQAEQALKRGVS